MAFEGGAMPILKDLRLEWFGLERIGGDEAAGDGKFEDGYEGVLTVELCDGHFSIRTVMTGMAVRRELEFVFSADEPLGE